MNNEVWEAVQTIKHNKAHVDAIKYLSLDLQLCLDKSNHIATIRKTSLRIIKKLNRGKDKAIDALCDPDEKDEYRKRVSNHE